MSEATAKGACIVCEADSDSTALIPFEFKGKSYHVCAQHLPVLIHKPEQLVGRLPGAEGIGGAAGCH